MIIKHSTGSNIHKKVISFCEKQMDGPIVDQGMIKAITAAKKNAAATDAEKNCSSASL